ncbi:MAG: nickel pincer cofactor biosynthesis protein LarC [Acidobacteriota bacterium]|nr:nickel pincer cofactor biosynthesis protein LarC [Acidobacteriota bacterium]
MAASHLHFDCFSGVAGDMFLGACLDLGMPLAVVEETIVALGLEGVTVESRRVKRGGISGVRFRVLRDGAPVDGPDPGEPATDEHRAGRHDSARSLAEIREHIAAAELGTGVRERALRIFDRLGEAEAAVHGVEVDEVHFHEVGAVDAMVDVVGAAAAWEHLGAPRASCGTISVGSGTVDTAHGELPVPAPATARLLEGMPVQAGGSGELVTPTGAAILAVLVDEFVDLPQIELDRVGYGLGMREVAGRANVFRLLAGSQRATEDAIVRVECTVDDVSGEVLGHLMTQLLEGPAVEVFHTPVQMKKNRPGVCLTVLCSRQATQEVAATILAETGALGCRFQELGRLEARRRRYLVQTPYGAVSVKEGVFRGRRISTAPEYEDCRRLAREHDLPIAQVYQAALAAVRQGER